MKLLTNLIRFCLKKMHLKTSSVKTTAILSQYVNGIIPHPIASEQHWLVKAPRWTQCVPGVSDRRSWRFGCHAQLWIIDDVANTSTFVNIASLCFRSIKRRQWKHKLDYYGVIFVHLATGCGINAKEPWSWIQISESRTQAVARIPLGLKPLRDSHTTSPPDSPIWIQPLGVFRYKIRGNRFYFSADKVSSFLE